MKWLKPESNYYHKPATPTEAIWRSRWFLAKLNVLGQANNLIDGWLDPKEGWLLSLAAAAVPHGGHIVEIGSFAGKSTAYLLHGAALSGSTVVAVDLFNGKGLDEEGVEHKIWDEVLHGETWPLFAHTIRKYCSELCPNYPTSFMPDFLSVLRGDSVHHGKHYDGPPVDMMFIDGNHSKCQQDFEAWAKSMTPDALITFHDVTATKTYGVDGPINTVQRLLADGWYCILQEGLLVGLTRNREWWEERIKLTQDNLTVAARKVEST